MTGTSLSSKTPSCLSGKKERLGSAVDEAAFPLERTSANQEAGCTPTGKRPPRTSVG